MFSIKIVAKSGTLRIILSVADFATILTEKSCSKFPVYQEKHYTPKLFFYSMTLPTALYNSALFGTGWS